MSDFQPLESITIVPIEQFTEGQLLRIPGEDTPKLVVKTSNMIMLVSFEGDGRAILNEPSYDCKSAILVQNPRVEVATDSAKHRSDIRPPVSGTLLFTPSDGVLCVEQQWGGRMAYFTWDGLEAAFSSRATVFSSWRLVIGEGDDLRVLYQRERPED